MRVALLLLLALALACCDAALLSQWSMQSSANVEGSDEMLHSVAFPTDTWYNVTVPCTVMAGLVEAGVYKDLFYGLNLQDVSAQPFLVPWYFRTVFDATESFRNAGASGRILLTFKGVNYRANIYLNGDLLGNTTEVVGPFRYFTFDVTDTLKGGDNVLTVETYRPKDSAFPPGNNDTGTRVGEM